MAAIERWNDEAIDKLSDGLQDLQLQSGIAHAVQNAQILEVAKDVKQMRKDQDEFRQEVRGLINARQMTWAQALTIAGVLLIPMVTLVGLVLGRT